MEDLPELPFERLLSYLNLADRLRARAVCKRWREKFDTYPVKHLCFSNRPAGFCWGKRRLVSGVYTGNFISSRQFATFFNAYASTILTNLKHLRLCDFGFGVMSQPAFACTLNLFAKLEQLDIIRLNYPSNLEVELKLDLPMLQRIHLEEITGMARFALDTAKLQEVVILKSFFLRLDLVHTETVETLITNSLRCEAVKKFKNLKFLHSDDTSVVDSTILYDLKQLKEVHLSYLDHGICELFEQKRLDRRADLKVYLLGLLLTDPDDPELDSFDSIEEAFVPLAANLPRLADEIRFHRVLNYSTVDRVPAGSDIEILKRFTDLDHLSVDQPVQDVQRFLNLFKHLDIIELVIFCDQPQELFDRLPEHSSLQMLTIEHPKGSNPFAVPSQHSLGHFEFLFGLHHLIELCLDCSIDLQLIQRICEGLQFLARFEFKLTGTKYGERFVIKIDHLQQFELYRVSYGFLGEMGSSSFVNLDAVIQHLHNFTIKF